MGAFTVPRELSNALQGRRRNIDPQKGNPVAEPNPTTPSALPYKNVPMHFHANTKQFIRVTDSNNETTV